MALGLDLKISFTVEGKRKLLTTFRRWDYEMRREVAKVVRRSVINIRDRARQYAPVGLTTKTAGMLRRRIRGRYLRKGLLGAVRSRAPHALHVEAGTRKMSARPYLYRAYDAELRTFEENIRKAVMDRALRRAQAGV